MLKCFMVQEVVRNVENGKKLYMIVSDTRSGREGQNFMDNLGKKLTDDHLGFDLQHCEERVAMVNGNCYLRLNQNVQ
jgi:hypothetical protein